MGREPNTQQISASQLCGDNCQTDDVTTNFKLPSWQCFTYHISTIVICMNFFQLEKLIIQNIMYPMIPYVNMFGSRMESWTLTKMDNTLTQQRMDSYATQKPSYCKNFFSRINSLHALVMAMNSALYNRQATHFCSLDCQATNPPTNLIK